MLFTRHDQPLLVEAREEVVHEQCPVDRRRFGIHGWQVHVPRGLGRLVEVNGQGVEECQRCSVTVGICPLS